MGGAKMGFSGEVKGRGQTGGARGHSAAYTPRCTWASTVCAPGWLTCIAFFFSTLNTFLFTCRLLVTAFLLYSCISPLAREWLEPA